MNIIFFFKLVTFLYHGHSFMMEAQGVVQVQDSTIFFTTHPFYESKGKIEKDSIYEIGDTLIYQAHVNNEVGPIPTKTYPSIYRFYIVREEETSKCIKVTKDIANTLIIYQ